MQPDHEGARPVLDRAGGELGDDQASSSLEVYAACCVCGTAVREELLSSLGRCWDCIERAVAERMAGDAAWRAANPPPKPRRDCRTCADLGGVPQFERPNVNPQACTKPRWMRHLTPCAPAGTRPTSGIVRPGSPHARLRSLVKAVLDATVGERNSRLHWAACRAGEMVAAREVDEPTAIAVLQEAAAATGLGPVEFGDGCRGTIGSGLRTGRDGDAR